MEVPLFLSSRTRFRVLYVSSYFALRFLLHCLILPKMGRYCTLFMYEDILGTTITVVSMF
jgi:hypothetical protein